MAPTSPPAPLVADQRAEVRAILEDHGALAGSYAVLGPDPWRVLFTDDRSSFVPLLEHGGVVLCWRGPVGPDPAAALDVVLDYCRSRRRGLFILECDAAVAGLCRARGMSSRHIGTEVAVDLTSFSLAGRRRSKLRLAVNHARGVGITWRPLDPSDEVDARSMDQVEAAWKAERKERQTDSFLRTDWQDLMAHRRYLGAFDRGVLVAMVTSTPLSAKGWYLHDLVRHPKAERGALEGAITSSLEAMANEGFTLASSGPLPMWSPEGDLTPTGAVSKAIYHQFDRAFRFASINRFRLKLDGDHLEPIFVTYTRASLRPDRIWSLVHLLHHRLR